MILGANAILREMEVGNIGISPFAPENVGPNSVDLTLSSELLVYDTIRTRVLDLNSNNPTIALNIPPTGLILEPGKLYIGSTREYTSTMKHVPTIVGRSSIARLGISVEISAGLGDVGFCGTWTLEISVIEPVRIYPGIRICQIYYMECDDPRLYQGRYNGQIGPVASRFCK